MPLFELRRPSSLQTQARSDYVKAAQEHEEKVDVESRPSHRKSDDSPEHPPSIAPAHPQPKSQHVVEHYHRKERWNQQDPTPQGVVGLIDKMGSTIVALVDTSRPNTIHMSECTFMFRNRRRSGRRFWCNMFESQNQCLLAVRSQQLF